MHQVKPGTWGKQQNRGQVLGQVYLQSETATRRTQEPITIEGIADESSRKRQAKSRLRALRAKQELQKK